MKNINERAVVHGYAYTWTQEQSADDLNESKGAL